MTRSLMGLGLLLMGCPTAFASPSSASGRVGIFVGSNGAPEGRTPLQHAESDAIRMRRVFIELGGLNPADAYLLQGPTADEVLEVVRKAGAQTDMLVFYYSGHADDRALLLEASQLSFGALNRALEQTGAQLSLHLVDACRSGGLVRAKGASLGDRFVINAQEHSEGKVVITSSAQWEDSYESDHIGGSFFTLHMATGLRGAADEDDDGQVTVSEAYRYVYGRTVESTLASRAGVQHPTFAYDLSGRGDLVLTWLNQSGGTVVFGDGDYVLFDAQTGRVAAEIHSAQTRLRLASGTYRVSKRTKTAVLSGRLSMTPGQKIYADRHLIERVAYARLVRKGGPSAPAWSHAVRVMGGVRGRVADGIDASAVFRLGYELSLAELSVMPFVSGTTGATFDTPRLRYRTQEFGVGALVSRAFDFRYATIRSGLLVEGLRMGQTETSGREPNRSTLAGAFAAHLAFESPPVWNDLFVSVATEAVLYVYPFSNAEVEPASTSEIATRPTYRVMAALGYEF